ncbi:hypothetical protein ACR3K2_27160 [Cryptosporidium serpentis]
MKLFNLFILGGSVFAFANGLGLRSGDILPVPSQVSLQKYKRLEGLELRECTADCGLCTVNCIEHPRSCCVKNRKHSGRYTEGELGMTRKQDKETCCKKSKPDSKVQTQPQPVVYEVQQPQPEPQPVIYEVQQPQPEPIIVKERKKCCNEFPDVEFVSCSKCHKKRREPEFVSEPVIKEQKKCCQKSSDAELVSCKKCRKRKTRRLESVSEPIICEVQQPQPQPVIYEVQQPQPQPVIYEVQQPQPQPVYEVQSNKVVYKPEVESKSILYEPVPVIVEEKKHSCFSKKKPENFEYLPKDRKYEKVSAVRSDNTIYLEQPAPIPEEIVFVQQPIVLTSSKKHSCFRRSDSNTKVQEPVQVEHKEKCCTGSSKKNRVLLEDRVPQELVIIQPEEVPVKEEVIVVPQQKVPVKEEVIIVPQQKVPVKEEVIIVPQQKVPVKEEVIIVPQQKVPVKEEVIIVPQQKVPVKEEIGPQKPKIILVEPVDSTPKPTNETITATRRPARLPRYFVSGGDILTIVREKK